MSCPSMIPTVGFAFNQRAIFRVVQIQLGLWLHCVTWGQTVDKPTSKGPVTQGDLSRNWTSFRGSGANGHATRANPPLSWSVKQSKNVAWKTPIAKHGMSSPVVWKDRVLLTAADEESRDIYCFDTETGSRIYIRGLRHLFCIAAKEH